MFESLKIVNILFGSLDKKEKQLKYAFDPTFIKENKEWKRHLYYADLKSDFIKEINEYGFSPYLDQTCEQQKNNKIIMKFYKPNFISNINYIRKLHKSSNHQYISKSSSLIKQKKAFKTKILQNKSNSMINNATKKSFKINKNYFLDKIYKKISETNSRSLSNIKMKKRSSVFMINRDENEEELLKDYEGCGDENSFIYEPIKIKKYRSEKKKGTKIKNITDKEDKKLDDNNNIEKQKIVKMGDIVKNINNNSVKKEDWKMTTDMDGSKAPPKSKISSSKIIKKLNIDKSFKLFNNIHKINDNKENNEKKSKIIKFLINNNRKFQNNKNILK